MYVAIYLRNHLQHMRTEGRTINENHIILWFLNFDLSHEEITTRLDLQPTCIATKGQEIVTSKGVKKISRHTFWEYEWQYESNEFIGSAVERFVDEVIKPRVTQIRSLAEVMDAEFKIVQYYHDGFTPGYHFKPDRLSILSAAGLDMDIDICCLWKEANQ